MVFLKLMFFPNDGELLFFSSSSIFINQLDNTERSNSVYVNTEEVENPNFIESSGE